jgi:hypothetical protein
VDPSRVYDETDADWFVFINAAVAIVAEDREDR